MSELLPKNIKEALEISQIDYKLFPCDPEFADTEGLIAKYGYPRQNILNTIIVVGRSEPRVYIACVILATQKLDVNKRVRKLLQVKSASFADSELTAKLTGMMIGGVTSFGLPSDMPVWIDQEVFNRDEVMLGGGNRSVKVIVKPDELKKIPSVEVVSDLGIKRENT